MKLLCLGLLSLSLPALATSCTSIITPNQTGTLTAKVLAMNGTELSGSNIHLFQNDRLVDVPLNKIPYGTYVLRISHNGYPVADESITIDEAYTFRRVELKIGDLCQSGRPTLAGSVEGPVLPQDLWIKAVPLRGNGYAIETKVESKGGFSLRGIDVGEYIFLLTSGSKVVHQAVHFVDSEMKPLRLQLPEPK